MKRIYTITFPFLFTSCSLLGGDGDGLIGPPDYGVCPDYIACSEATGVPTATLEATYGEDGVCWDESAESLCQAQCEDALALLAEVWVEEPACGGTLPPPTYEEGGWPIDESCNTSIVPTGDDVGDITAGTALLDQYGQTVDIHDFCEHAVLIVSDTPWLGGHVDYEELQVLQETYRDRGLIVVVGMLMNLSGDPPTQEDLMDEAEDAGAEFPFLADPDYELWYRFNDGEFWPNYAVLGPGAVVLARDTHILPEDELIAALPW